MPCQEINSWTFAGLAVAFLDLAVVFLLLCASAVVYLTSKFLGLFGLYLPRPCDGLFSGLDRKKYLQMVLANSPVEKISSVQGSVISKMPFDSVFSHDPRACSKLKLVKKGKVKPGDVEVKGEASCRFFPWKGWENEIFAGSDMLSSKSIKEEWCKSRRKGFSVRRTRCGFRRHRRCAHDRGEFSSISAYDHLQSDVHYVSSSPASIEKLGNHTLERSPVSFKSGDDEKATKRNAWHRNAFEMSEPGHEINPPQRLSSHLEEIKCKPLEDLGFEGNAQNTVRILEQALEEEQAVRSAVCLELEKERNAAATAADEAMSMILRLQEEKASIEMEARQYQRMIEEKSAFDAEEMNILKEILLRREREKYFMEKEVEEYRQMFLDNGQSEWRIQNTRKEKGTPLLYWDEDPEEMPHQIGESFCKGRELEARNKFPKSEVIFSRTQNQVLAFGSELPVPELDEDGDHLNRGEFCQDSFASTERKVHGVGELSDSTQSTSNAVNLPKKAIDLVQEKLVRHDRENQTWGGSRILTSYDDYKMEMPKEDSHDSRLHDDQVHDVHVICDEVGMSNEENGNKSYELEMNVSFDNPKPHSAASQDRLDFGLDRSRSVSAPHKLPPICPRVKTFSFDMRRKSMSAVDHERLKIENEVGWLRGRLQVVQQGREKLNFSIGNQEKDRFHNQNLDDIVSQLRGIRKLADAGGFERQGSLPPPTSKVKVMAKKRLWRSATLDLHSA